MAARNSPAAVPNASPGPARASSRPASAGPTNTPSDSTALESTFAAVRSAGSDTSAGTTADCAVRKTIVASATTVIRAMSAGSGRTAAAPVAAARATAAAPSRHQRCGTRSTSTPTAGPATAPGIVRASTATATAWLPPAEKAATLRLTVDAQEPIITAAQASCSRTTRGSPIERRSATKGARTPWRSVARRPPVLPAGGRMAGD